MAKTDNMRNLRPLVLGKFHDFSNLEKKIERVNFKFKSLAKTKAHPKKINKTKFVGLTFYLSHKSREFVNK